VTSSIVHPEPRLLSLLPILRQEWKLVVFGSLFSLILASVLTSGWPNGLWPDISVPLRYSGDGLFHAWMAQRVTEGWLFENARSGYPFGSTFLDFPGSDAGSHFLIKVLSLLSGSSFTGVNLFFLLSFPVCFVTTYLVVRAFGLVRSLAVVSALLFTFLPFHILRLGHLFYTWYFVVPLFYYLSFYLLQYSSGLEASKSNRLFSIKSILIAAGLLVLSSFGVYYALFGVLMVSLAGILGWLATGQVKAAGRPLLVAAVLIFGVLLNVLPNLIGKYQLGANMEVAQRAPMESEVYGLKLMQLILPRADHRISSLGKFTNFYNGTFPLVNENSTSVLGVVGAFGLLIGFCLLLWSLAGRRLDRRLGYLVAVIFLLFMFGTIGGLGSFFSSFISSSIRAWNRISVFIGFGAILIFFIVLQGWIDKRSSKVKRYVPLIAGFVLFLGIYDQTIPACKSCNVGEKNAYESDKEFVHSIEMSVPEGAAIYQLPYLAFPEAPAVHNLYNYQMAAGVLHSKSLHWSFGGMKGRPGDLFYRSLSQESVERQLEVVRNLGFSGIYIDRRGYADNAQDLVSRLTTLLGSAPSLSSKDGNIVFFKLAPATNENLVGKDSSSIMNTSGYYADSLGQRSPASLHDGIDFTKAEWPQFVRDVRGFSGREQWGRWSDANISKSVHIYFREPLPQKFTLALIAQAFASNANAPIKVVVGTQEYELILGSQPSEVNLQIDLQGESVDSISFIPPKPISPLQAGVNGDVRKLGIGFISLRLIE
jgi:Predicted integral membrane protein